jgi:Tat protein translocase TatB subunit
MGEFSFGEMVVVVIVAILIYGKDLPQAARKMANLYSKLRRQLSDVRDELQRQIPADELRIDTSLDANSGMEPPQTPTGLVASASTGQISLTWNSAPGATSYMVRRSKGEAEPWVVLAAYVVDLAFTDADVEAGKTYRYTVSAQNSAGESGESDLSAATVPGGETAPEPEAAAPATSPSPEPPPPPTPAPETPAA